MIPKTRHKADTAHFDTKSSQVLAGLEFRWKVIRFTITAGLLFPLWFIFSPTPDTFTVITGLIAALSVAAISHETFIQRHEAAAASIIASPVRLAVLFLKLTIAMYVSSYAVLKAMVFNRFSPRIVHFRTRLGSDIGRAALANAITFTPGTITLDLDDDHLTVHWLLATSTHSRHAKDEIAESLEKELQCIWH